MTSLRVVDITTYLEDAGWRRRPERWRGASIWSDGAEHELLVPERDDVRDGDLRVREILDVLATAEGRAADDVASDIASPLVDTQSYRTFPEGLPDGLTSLGEGARALAGVVDAFVAAGRSVVEGPHHAFQGRAPKEVNDLRNRAQLGQSRSGSYTFVVRVPVVGPASFWDDAPLGRQVLRQLHDAVSAAESAVVARASLAAFDDAVTAGISANLCYALSDLAGPRGRQAFEVGFRWARGLAADRPPAMLRFPDGSGEVLRAAARHLESSAASGSATVGGTIESLHDDPPRDDRWRVRVRGELLTSRGRGLERTVWVRLADQATYDRAMSAHRLRQPVTATGELASVAGRVELVTRPGGFDVA